MEYVLFEDAVWRRLLPLTWLRPVYDLLVGAWTLRQRWRNALGRERLHFAARPELLPLLSDRYGERAGLPRGSDVCFLNGAWVAPPDAASLLAGLEAGQGWAHRGRVLALRVSCSASERAREILECLLREERPGDVVWRDVPGSAAGEPRCVTHLWDLVSWTESLLPEDLRERLGQPYGEGTVVKGEIENADEVSLGAGVSVGPGAVLDASDGPVVLEAGCAVAPLTWVKGPVWAGPGTKLLGERIERSAIGPACKVHGELESSVILGYSNKAHEGFVGHSYLGEWVNLGALTTTSDLKNTYGTIRIVEEGETVSTGMIKLGSFLGDHTKTAIGTLLSAGCVAGVGSHIFGGPGLTQREIPSFAWGVDSPGRRFEIDRFLVTAQTVMSRRGLELTPALRSRLRDVFRETA